MRSYIYYEIDEISDFLLRDEEDEIESLELDFKNIDVDTDRHYISSEDIPEDASDDELYEIIVSALFSKLELYQNLKDLGLKNTNGIEKYCGLFQSVGQALKLLKNLESLSMTLSKTDIETDDAQALGEGLKSLVNLETLVLDLQETNLQEDGLIAISEGIGKCTNLIYLNINVRKNFSHRVESAVLGKQIVNCKNLKGLKLAYNDNYNYSDYTRRSIVGSVLGHSFEFLTFIDLDLCVGLDEYEAIGIASGLRYCKDLRSLKLDFSTNEIDLNSVKIIGASLRRCLNLTTLYIDVSEQVRWSKIITWRPKKLKTLVKDTFNFYKINTLVKKSVIFSKQYF